MRRGDLGLLALAVVAVSISGPLIREADAPALAIASWRNVIAALVLAVVVGVGHRRGMAALTTRERRLVVLSGLLLAAHFATWIPSLEPTTIASSVALVCTQPVWAAGIARLRGEPVPGRVWLGVVLAVAGVVVLCGVDLSVSARALGGDALALAGGAFAAGYVSVGSAVRRTVDNPVYTFGCYGVAGIVLGLLAAGTGQDLTGFDGRTWGVLVALAAGPQLLGHSVFNRVLPSVGPLVVSVSVLLEVIGATLLAWWWFGESPPAAAAPAAVLILGGVFLVVTADRAERPIPLVV